MRITNRSMGLLAFVFTLAVFMYCEYGCIWWLAAVPLEFEEL